MIATLTSKGQLTLPKEIRDRLGLNAGSKLDFQLQPDDSISVRAVRKPNALSVRGLIKSPLSHPLTVEQMDEAIGQHLRAKHRR